MLFEEGICRETSSNKEHYNGSKEMLFFVIIVKFQSCVAVLDRDRTDNNEVLFVVFCFGGVLW